MKKLTLLLIVGLCLAVSGLADVVDKPQAGDKKPQAKQGKTFEKQPLLRKPPKLKPSPLLRKAAPPRNERGGNHNSGRSNTSRRAPQKGDNTDNGRAETQYPNKQKYRLDLARPARKGNARQAKQVPKPPRKERGGDHNSTRSKTSRRAPQKGAGPDQGRLTTESELKNQLKATRNAQDKYIETVNILADREKKLRLILEKLHKIEALVKQLEDEALQDGQPVSLRAQRNAKGRRDAKEIRGTVAGLLKMLEE